VKASRGLELKKQMPSDCDFKNLRRLGDGTGLCNADCISAEDSIAILA
jgi:hypothetical protein